MRQEKCQTSKVHYQLYLKLVIGCSAVRVLARAQKVPSLFASKNYSTLGRIFLNAVVVADDDSSSSSTN